MSAPLPNSFSNHLEAMRFAARGVVDDPENVEHQITFSNLVMSCTFSKVTEHTNTIKEAARICLEGNNVRSLLLFQVWHSLLGLDENVPSFFEKAQTSHLNGESFDINFEELKSFLNDPFFLVGLKRFNLARIEYEYLLTALRSLFLLSHDYQPEDFLPFICSLAEQCHLNEYIYRESEQEQEKVRDLIKNVPSMSGDRVDDIKNIALIGCYVPLLDLEVEKIENFTTAILNKPFDDLVHVQINDMRTTQEYFGSIPFFSTIKNDVSSSVASQYEENPYPRWRYIHKPNLTDDQKEMSSGKSIMVAGCGTGQELLNVALYYPNANVLGVDLSAASLAYAKQKSEELGVRNVELLQADILDLNSLDREFDMITCGGVLHHMENPVEGWKNLIHCMKPDGAMKIALYSEIARRYVVQCREWIKEKKFECTKEDIKKFRQQVISMDHSSPLKNIMHVTDFFSLSMCRDLVFHVQEHRFTLLQIKQILNDLDLEFIALRCKNQGALQKYLQLNPGDPEAKNLDNWHEFEKKHPNVFWGMYPFWCNKKGHDFSGKLPEWIFAQ